MKTLFIIAVLHFTATTFLNPAPAEVAIIVNNENPVGQLSAGEVKLYWLRKIKKRWPVVNKNIKPVDRKTTNPDQDIFYSKVLGMSASDVETYFNQKQYESGEKPANEKQLQTGIRGDPSEVVSNGIDSSANLHHAYQQNCSKNYWQDRAGNYGAL